MRTMVRNSAFLGAATKMAAVTPRALMSRQGPTDVSGAADNIGRFTARPIPAGYRTMQAKAKEKAKAKGAKEKESILD